MFRVHPKPIRKVPRSKHKFQPILSRMNACAPNMYCDSCMKEFEDQVESERPGHVWAVKDGEVVYMEDMVVEHHLGRPLLPTESVIHKNGNLFDNRFENLEIITIDNLETE